MKLLMQGIIMHALIYLLMLSLGYNTYKEVLNHMQHFLPLSLEARYAIQSEFPLILLIFSGLYTLFFIRARQHTIILSMQHYIQLALSHAALTNLIIFTHGKNELIALNISAVWYIIFILCFFTWRRYANNSQHIMPLGSKLPRILHMLSSSPKPYIITFFFTLTISSLFSVFGILTAAEQCANAAYFSLTAGVAIGLYADFKAEDTED